MNLPVMSGQGPLYGFGYEARIVCQEFRSLVRNRLPLRARPGAMRLNKTTKSIIEHGLE